MVSFVDDIRMTDVSGEHDALAASMTNMMSILERLGVRYHTKEGKRWWPTRVIPWLGFEVDTRVENSILPQSLSPLFPFPPTTQKGKRKAFVGQKRELPQTHKVPLVPAVCVCACCVVPGSLHEAPGLRDFRVYHTLGF